MANLNKVMLIGRLTRDPEAIAGGKGAKFGFAVNNRKLNQQTNQWEEVPVFIDCEIWNRGEMGKQAENILRLVTKGRQLFLEGHLKLDEWEDKNGGGKRTKLAVVVENFQFCDAKPEGMNEGGGTMRAAPRQAMPARQSVAAPKSYSNEYDDAPMGATAAGGGGGKGEDDIPF